MDVRTAEILVLFMISVLFAVLGNHPVNVRNISDILTSSGYRHHHQSCPTRHFNPSWSRCPACQGSGNAGMVSNS
ncbi:hypothetical protein B0H11DRAFT_2124586 [Mycena galericulata]|nr:hypothetical protein B0H11DRAFT_2124586 [Mycena galericulata]